MFKLCSIDIRKSEEIYKKIELYCQRLIAELNPYLILLFGSFATGDIHEASDIDIIVVADFKQPFLDRIKLLKELDLWHLPLEPIGYTPDEWEGMKKRGSPFTQEAISKGKVLYQKSN